MTLNEIQTKQANDLIKRYGFPTIETQEKLEEADFFKDFMPNFCLIKDKTTGEILVDFNVYILNDFVLGRAIVMPQFHEIWKEVKNAASTSQIMDILYSDNETETACLLWIELRKGGSL